MQRIATDLYLEKSYPGPHLGLVVGPKGVVLVDCPVQSEDGQKWLSQISSFGRRRYLALMDHHADRVVGARSLGLPIVAHDHTREAIANWSDVFKGSAHPIGALSDQIKRVTGVSKSVPELTFSKRMVISLGDRQVHFEHRPGPSAGSMWVIVPDALVAFIGDAVMVSEAPFLASANLDSWLGSLEALRGLDDQGYTLVSARDGLVERADINAMARFLRRIGPGLEKASQVDDPQAAITKLSKRLLASFKVPAPKRKMLTLRLATGLSDLSRKMFPPGK